MGKMTSRGQVTIPQEFREKGGFAKDGYVAFRMMGPFVVVGKADQPSLSWEELTAPIRAQAKKQGLRKFDVVSEIKTIRKGLYDERGLLKRDT